MDEQKNRLTQQQKAEQKRRQRESFQQEENSLFTDKERKREAMKQSTIGGF